MHDNETSGKKEEIVVPFYTTCEVLIKKKKKKKKKKKSYSLLHLQVGSKEPDLFCIEVCPD